MIFSVVQLVPLPLNFLELISTSSVDVYTNSAGTTSSKPISIDQGNSAQELIKNISYILLLFLVTALVDSKARIRALGYMIIISGFIQAFLGLYSKLSGISLVPLEYLDGHYDRISGTFVNRNHYSNFLVMTFFVSLGMILTFIRKKRQSLVFKERIKRLFFIATQAQGLLILTSIPIVSAILLSNSRGGIVAFMISFVLVFITLLFREKGAQYNRHFVAVVGIIFISSVAWMGYGQLVDRFSGESITQSERIVQWKLSSALAKDHWLVGIGPGNYEWLFPAYRTGELRSLVYDHAHNDYLEFTIEQGLVGVVLLGSAISLCLFKIYTAIRKRKDRLMLGVLVGAFGASTAMLTHSLVEFNFHIPANAATFFVILGLGLSATVLKHNA